jgi:hypothetical protein
MRKLIPRPGGFLLPALYGQLPVDKIHTFQLNFSSLSGIYDEVYCRLYVGEDQVLRLEDWGDSSKQNATKALTQRAPAPVPLSDPVRIPLYEAAMRAYEETSDVYGTIASHMSKNDPEEMIRWFCYLLSPKLTIFGQQQPSRKNTIYSNKEHRNDYDLFIEDKHIIARERHGKGRWINLNVIESELDAVILVLRK